MTKTSKLIELVGFEQPQAGSDGGGGVVDGFAEQFERRADFVHLRGGEAVLAARLQGEHSQVIQVRRDPESSAVTADWRIVDKRAPNDVYNIRDIEPSKDRRWLFFTCQRGVAT